MPVYVWKGMDRKGKRQNGEIEADNPTIARQLLVRKGSQCNAVSSLSPRIFWNISPSWKTGSTERELVVFVRQFSTMIDAGLPLVQCLDILQQQQESRAFKRILKQVKKDVEEGATFSDAIKKHPKAFDNLFVNLVAAGEMGGHPRCHPQSPGGLHRETGKIEEEGKRSPHLSRYRRHHRPGGHGGDPHLCDSRLCSAFRGCGSYPANLDAFCHVVERFCSSVFSIGLS